MAVLSQGDNRPTADRCGNCHATLPPRELDGPVNALVFVGGAGVGKSTLAGVMAAYLCNRLGPALNLIVDPWDESARHLLEHAEPSPRAVREQIAQVSHVRSDNVGTDPRAQSALFRLASSEPRRGAAVWLTLIETPGIPWENRDAALVNSAHVVTRAQTLILVIDPTRLAPVEAALRKRESDAWRHGRPSPHPSTPYRRRLSAADEIRHLALFFGRRALPIPSKIPVAIVLAKFDAWGLVAPPGTLLRRLAEGATPAHLGVEDIDRIAHDESEALLVEWTGESLSQQIDQKFANVRFFPVSALGEAVNAPPDVPVAPIPMGVDSLARWCLGQHGQTLAAPQRSPDAG